MKEQDFPWGYVCIPESALWLISVSSFRKLPLSLHDLQCKTYFSQLTLAGRCHICPFQCQFGDYWTNASSASFSGRHKFKSSLWRLTLALD